MRDIKFRAWDKKENKWIENGFNGIGLTLDGIPSWLDHGEMIDDACNDIELLQYTGLKDCNGKEIYEGDILKCWVVGRKYENYIVKWSVSEGTYKAYDKDEVYYIDCKSWRIQEIIGNIYENPELLEVNKNEYK